MVKALLLICTCFPIASANGVAAGAQRGESKSLPTASALEMDIVKTIISGTYRNPEQLFVLVRESVPVFKYRDSHPGLKGPTIKALLETLKKVNSVPAVFPEFEHDRVGQFAGAKQIDSIFDKGGWDDFYRAYPGSDGTLRFTRPAFSTFKQKALVYHARNSGGLNGDGSLYYLENVKGRWVIKRTILVWIS